MAKVEVIDGFRSPSQPPYTLPSTFLKVAYQMNHRPEFCRSVSAIFHGETAEITDFANLVKFPAWSHALPSRPSFRGSIAPTATNRAFLSASLASALANAL